MNTTKLIAVTLMSITLLALELVWTRLFSAEFFYTFAFLTLSLAVLGLGLGGLAIRLFPFLNRQGSPGVFLSLAGLMAFTGPPVVFRLELDFPMLLSSWIMMSKFLLVLFLLSSSFFLAGMALALIFKTNHEEIPRLYMSDLTGAGIGVLFAILMMNGFGTPVAAFLIAIPILLASILISRGPMKLVPGVLIIIAAALSSQGVSLLEPEREERAPVIYKHWDAMAKIKVYDFEGQYRGLNIDNVANSPVIPFDWDWETFRADTTGGWNIDVGYLVSMFDSCTFLSLGAGAGSDVLQALDKGASEIHAVEVNPHINRMMIEGDPSGYISNDSTVVDSTGNAITLAEYSGHIYRDHRVKVVSEDARTYVRRYKNKFDIIYSLSSNTWAALGSGSFALAENYLFTTEAFRDYWEALSENGFLSMEHQMYMPRLVSELMHALEELGVENVKSHFAVYDLPQMRRNLLLLSKQPLTDEIRQNAYGKLTPEIYDAIHLLYPAPDSLQGNLINQIVLNGWEAAADSAAIDISPCDDNRPFAAQLGLWKNFEFDKLGKVNKYSEFSGFPLSKLIIAIILLVALLLIVPLNLIPYFQKSERLKVAPWLYFFAIGMAFMMVEVVLIQKYALFIGASVYSIATVLLTLLVASGIGSRFAEIVGEKLAFGGILVWLFLELTLFEGITYGLVYLTMLPRVLVTALLIFPLGFCMGIPFPRGVARIGPLVDWGFAVNGVASVIGATLIMAVAFSYGFDLALCLGTLVYLFAFSLFVRESSW
jgi:hypothetical protein